MEYVVAALLILLALTLIISGYLHTQSNLFTAVTGLTKSPAAAAGIVGGLASAPATMSTPAQVMA